MAIKIRWKVDEKLEQICKKEFNRNYLKLIPYLRDKDKVLDYAGGSGWIGNLLKKERSDLEIINMDLDKNELAKTAEGIKVVQGNMLELPFQENDFKGVLCRAALHHVPKDLDKALAELRRVVKGGGALIIEEPGYYNPNGWLARKNFTTNIHEAGEKAFNLFNFKKTIGKYFKIKEIRYFFLFSYLSWHIVALMPKPIKPFFRICSVLVNYLDRMLLFLIPPLRFFAGYIRIVAINE